MDDALKIMSDQLAQYSNQLAQIEEKLDQRDTQIHQCKLPKCFHVVRVSMFILVQDTIQNLNVECTAPSTTSTLAPTTSTSSQTTFGINYEVKTQDVNQIIFKSGPYVASVHIDGVQYGVVTKSDVVWPDYWQNPAIELEQARVLTEKYSIERMTRNFKCITLLRTK